MLLVRPVAAVLGAVLMSGCAGRHGHRAGADSLEVFMAKVRAVSSRPVQHVGRWTTVEQRSPELAAALAALLIHPGADAHVAVADAYAAVGILDSAYSHLTRALQLQPSHAGSYERLARVWRDWGFPQLGLGDAHRAIFYAPTAAAPRNTLGTILQAMGRPDDARRVYEEALRLDATAAYAFVNLCRMAILAGRSADAVAACRGALAIDPSLEPARNGLALAYAQGGEPARGIAALPQESDAATNHYNRGVLLFMNHEYTRAAVEFRNASRRRPGWTTAAVRAKQADAEAAAAGHPGTRP